MVKFSQKTFTYWLFFLESSVHTQCISALENRAGTSWGSCRWWILDPHFIQRYVWGHPKKRKETSVCNAIHKQKTHKRRIPEKSRLGGSIACNVYSSVSLWILSWAHHRNHAEMQKKHLVIFIGPLNPKHKLLPSLYETVCHLIQTLSSFINWQRWW